ncbi:hypothetical protein DDE18_01175 [Nocardioides gansuensis]|uniref:Uncharacterized protein n=1 Tax=Nocardioides gansuensis TaxID=2138300 RepID=A0A2T8FEY9_9ACTN|nr:hypothetical protein [Nocardioides gansuensis]PVG84274.1 hypothetical protein DDE18_01175 [Nocardioides gansuensis]
MTWRGGLAVAVLLALGLVGGYAASATWSARTVASDDPATPVPAQPELPSDPEPVVNPDPDQPPLATDLEYHVERLGDHGFEVDVPVPNGWSQDISEIAEWKWKPKGYPPFTYVLRVERVAGERRTIPSMLAQRIVGLHDDIRISDVEITERTSDSLAYDYVFNGYRRHAFITWIDVSGSGEAEMEVATNGRERDVEGMRTLVEHVASGMQPVTP